MIEFLEARPALLAVAIFLARMADVSMGTLRTILVFRGHRIVAATIGFFEVLIWVAAAGLVLKNVGTWYLAASYAAGFAAGNIVGSWLDSKLALGTELVRVISANEDIQLATGLRAEGFTVTELKGEGDAGGVVEVLLVVARRRRVPGLLREIIKRDPDAVCTMSDVREHAPLPSQGGLSRLPGGNRGRGLRK